MTCVDFSKPVEELEYTCLLKNTFTEESHDRVFKTWQTPATYPECVFCGKMYRWQTVYVECHMDPNISKVTTDRERVVTSCVQSQSTSRGIHRKNAIWRWLEDMQTVLWICVEKTTLMQSTNVSVRDTVCRQINRVKLSSKDGGVSHLSRTVWVLLLLMILSFGRSSSQPIVWGNQPCVWARELHFERGTLHCHITIHSLGKLFQRQTSL
jgi:hypothetical protein